MTEDNSKEIRSKGPDNEPSLVLITKPASKSLG